MSEENTDNAEIDLDEDDVNRSNQLLAITQFNNILVAAITLIAEYCSQYIERTPCMTSGFIGDKWLHELILGHPLRFQNLFRMSKVIFMDLLAILETSHGLHGSRRTTSREVLAITLYILAQNESNRATCERFQHSTETISRYFSIGLRALVHLSIDIISPTDKQFRDIPLHILNDERYMPYFKDCIGAIDGTHVDARIPVEDQVAFIGRHHFPTQNVMAVCDFNMCFTFVAPGWEGSAHDARIFQRAVTDPTCNFPSPPPGKYYLVDAGYALQRGYLKPYPETRYHLPDFTRGTRLVRGRHEIFNKRHSSLRSVIERTFGVWKKKWSILRDMPNYSFKKQVLIVVATMTLHNFIRKHHSRSDPEFEECDVDENFVHAEVHEYRAGANVFENLSVNGDADQVDGEGAEEMAGLRERIAIQLENSNL